MSPAIAVTVMMSNYFHDVATAMLMACSLTMRLMLRRYETNPSRDVVPLLSHLHSRVSKVFTFSVIWIFSGGIVRILTFWTFEWKNAVMKHQESGLIVKYIIAFFLMVAGTYLWIGVSKRIREIQGGSRTPPCS